MTRDDPHTHAPHVVDPFTHVARQHSCACHLRHPTSAPPGPCREITRPAPQPAPIARTRSRDVRHRAPCSLLLDTRVDSIPIGAAPGPRFRPKRFLSTGAARVRLVSSRHLCAAPPDKNPLPYQIRRPPSPPPTADRFLDEWLLIEGWRDDGQTGPRRPSRRSIRQLQALVGPRPACFAKRRPRQIPQSRPLHARRLWRWETPSCNRATIGRLTHIIHERSELPVRPVPPSDGVEEPPRE